MSCRSYFINSALTAVDDDLLGFVIRSPNLLLTESKRIVLRKDFEDLRKRGQVTLLSGGGSGHEPSHAGYVGRGMLTAAVAGDTFASPPVSHILAALQAIKSFGGVVAIVKNYTGDRLNFGLAVEQFITDTGGATRVEIVLVEDDCATTESSAGARGLCGTVLMHKILGAMAEDGRPFEEILEVAKQVSARMTTLAAALGHCELPTTGTGEIPHKVDKHEEAVKNSTATYEIGLGIHNEPGASLRSWEPAQQVVATLLKIFLNKFNWTSSSEEFIVVVNNLGGLSMLEINIICKELVYGLKASGRKVTGIIVGTLMTSLNMPGFSITLLESTNDLLRCLRCPTDCSAWPGVFDVNENFKYGPLSMEETTTTELPKEEFLISAEQAQLVRTAFVGACRALIAEEEHLNHLDRVTGDGDCGATMAKLANKALVSAETVNFRNLEQLFRRISIAAGDTGGTTGALYGILFNEFAKEIAGKDPVDPIMWVLAVDRALQGFRKHSRAQPGERSMFDALLAISDGLKDLTADWKKNVVVLQRTAKQCDTTALETKDMVSVVGRASYSSARNDLENAPDAGAVAVSVWFSAIATILGEA